MVKVQEEIYVTQMWHSQAYAEEGGRGCPVVFNCGSPAILREPCPSLEAGDEIHGADDIEVRPIGGEDDANMEIIEIGQEVPK